MNRHTVTEDASSVMFVETDLHRRKLPTSGVAKSPPDRLDLFVRPHRTKIAFLVQFEDLCDLQKLRLDLRIFSSRVRAGLESDMVEYRPQPEKAVDRNRSLYRDNWNQLTPPDELEPK